MVKDKVKRESEKRSIKAFRFMETAQQEAINRFLQFINKKKQRPRNKQGGIK